MAYTKAYVFARNPAGETALAGSMSAEGGQGGFRYADSWLQASWAYPLDPVNLPLSPKHYQISNRNGVFGVFSDAGPDDWGMRIMLQRHSHAPENEIERLLRSSGSGVGLLRFSLSRSRPLSVPPLPSFDLLNKLEDVTRRLEARRSLSDEELALIEPGSSMGGARPKVSIQDEEGVWLVKFGRESDPVDMARLEYASMGFVKEKLGLNVTALKLKEIGNGRNAYAIKRFDRGPQGWKHFISAHSLFRTDRVRLIRDSRLNPYSYVNLAAILRKHSAAFREDCEELFRRMVTNIVLGNTDDHARNHAMIFNPESGHWRLSPAYDMVPVIASASNRQAMGVGNSGADATVENALSCARLFGLTEKKAASLVEEILAAFQSWDAWCRECGLTDMEIDLTRKVRKA